MKEINIAALVQLCLALQSSCAGKTQTNYEADKYGRIKALARSGLSYY